jgi:hypothetical protein
VENTVHLRFITVASDLYNAPKERLIMESLNGEVIVLLADVKYFEELEQAAKIRKYIMHKNLSQLPDSVKEIIRQRQAQARLLEEIAKKQIDKAIEGGTYYIYGDKAELRSGDSKFKLDAALRQLIESVYAKLNFISDYCESDADILIILNGPQSQGTLGTSYPNEDALNEVSLWLELQSSNRVPVSMGDVQRRYQAIPYGWREIDIAALVARLIALQKVSVKYGGAMIGKEDRKLVEYLRKKSEIDKLNVSRRIAPSEELMRKCIVFLRDWLGSMGVPDDEDGLILFVKDTLSPKLEHYTHLLEVYSSHHHYPEKGVVTAARDLMKEILEESKDNVALLTMLLAKQDDLRDCTEDMEVLETFFKSQRAIFDAAQKLMLDLQHERDYFATDPLTSAQISEVASILALPQPYGRIKDLSELMQGIRNAYEVLLTQKQEEVRGIIVQCLGDVHTLAGVRAKEEVRKSDQRFDEYKQRVTEATSLTVLDAMITQLLNYKGTVCKNIELIFQETVAPYEVKPRQNILQLRRYDIFPAKRLLTREEVDSYLTDIRTKRKRQTGRT